MNQTLAMKICDKNVGTLQMFAGNCRDSAGGFLQYLQGKCVIFTGLQGLQGKFVYITGFSLQILQSPCNSLQTFAVKHKSQRFVTQMNCLNPRKKTRESSLYLCDLPAKQDNQSSPKPTILGRLGYASSLFKIFRLQ